jgi:hypothetical protein
MNKTKLDYSKVKVEFGLPIPSLRRKFRKLRAIKRNSLVGLLASLSLGESVFLPIFEHQIKSLGVMVAQAQKRLNGPKFAVRNYFNVAKMHRGARVWRVV